METKISFGFSKTAKKPNVIVSQKPLEKKSVELIDCLEGQTIKIKNAVEEKEKAPLEIPIRDDSRNLLDRVKAVRSKQKENSQNVDKSLDNNEKPDSGLSLDELAAKELIKDAKNWEKNKKATVNSKVHELPLAGEQVALEGANESTMEDYENVPIGDYGLAMLRGMGWKEGAGIGKNAKLVKMDQPESRPKGLGLGANKMVATKQKAAVDPDGNELILKVNAYAKVVAGNHQGIYGQVQSMDDENSLVFLKTAIKGEILKLNDIFLLPVTMEEYSMCSRVLNNKKYAEYKALSDKNLESQRRESSVPDDDSNSNENSKHSKNRQSDDKQFSDRRQQQEERSNSRHRSNSNDSDDSQKSKNLSNRDDDPRKSKNSSSRTSADQPSSSSRRNLGERTSWRVNHSSDSSSPQPSKSSSSSKYHAEGRKKSKPAGDSSSEDSDDNTDSSPSNRSHSRSHERNKANNRNSSSSSSDDYRSRSSTSRHEKRNPRSSGGSKKHKKHKKTKHRSHSSSNESGYEVENKRRKNKTKCRHRRYSNEESEEQYKKNKKNKR